MKFPDETLMAYADGELDAGSRAEIEAAMATDPDVARAVERHRELARRVRAAYRGVLDEPVPAALARLADPPVAAPVVDLDTTRGARASPRTASGRRQLPQWGALAASLALGILLGALWMRGDGGLYEETADGLLARGALDAALTARLAGSPGTEGPRVGLSFRDRSGRYCRTFHLHAEAPLAGLACRSGAAWKLQVLAAAVPQQGELQPAAALPLAVLQAVDAAIDGEPLDAAAERAARDAGWK